MTTARYVGMWHGGASYSAPDTEDAELFDSIAQAADAMRDRRNLGHWQPQTFRYVFRERARDLTPVAHSEDSGYIQLHRITPDMSPDAIREAVETGYPDRIIEFGPRGGIVVSRT